MRIDLFKSLEGVSYYGDIPEVHGLPESQVDSSCYCFDVELEELQRFADQVDEACGALIDVFDEDYFDAEKCKKLVGLLDALNCTGNESMDAFIADLRRCAQQAIKLGTGIVLEL